MLRQEISNSTEVSTDGEGTVSRTEDSAETQELAEQVDSAAEEWTLVQCPQREPA